MKSMIGHCDTAEYLKAKITHISVSQGAKISVRRCVEHFIVDLRMIETKALKTYNEVQ